MQVVTRREGEAVSIGSDPNRILVWVHAVAPRNVLLKLYLPRAVVIANRTQLESIEALDANDKRFRGVFCEQGEVLELSNGILIALVAIRHNDPEQPPS